MYRDEEGEPTYDPDLQFGEGSPGPEDEDEVEEEEEEWQDSPSASPPPRDSPAAAHSPTPRPRKRLVKKSNVDNFFELDADEDEDEEEREEERKEDEEDDEEDRPSNPKGGMRIAEIGERRKRPIKRKAAKPDGRERGEDGDGDGDVGGKKRKSSSESVVSKLAKLARGRAAESDKAAGSSRPSRNKERSEERSPWETPAAADDSEDRELEATADDDNFIDDEGVQRYSDDEDGYAAASPSHAPEAEEAAEDEEDDLGKILKSGKKKFVAARTSEEIAMYVEQFMAKLDVAAEADADLNRNSKPAIEKLKMLPELLNVLEKRQLQQEFLDRGVLSSLKNWLEPLPDGSLPNMNIRSALLKLLTDLPIEVDVFERREQLKKSGLGKVVMFLSKLAEETPVNKKMARDLVDKWSRPIFQKSTRYEDLRQYHDERPPPRRTPVKKPALKYRMDESRGGDELEVERDPEILKPGDPGYRNHASRPQALPLDFTIRPKSKVGGEDSRSQAKEKYMSEKRMKMNKKLQQLQTPKKKNLQAARMSVEGRGLVKYF